MGKAVLALILSAGFGIGLSFFNGAMGVVAAISIMGAFIIHSIEKSK